MNRKKILTLSLVAFFVLCGLIFCLRAGLVSGSVSLKKDMGDTCLECHPDLKQELIIGKEHGPLKNRDCISCHNPHAAKYGNLLSQTGDALCYGCHASEKAWLDDKVVHIPVEHGECLACHQPHVSSFSDLLRYEEREMCFQCHDREPFQRAYVHQPVKEGRCSTCHWAHSSSNSSLLKKPSAKLCIQCHSLTKGLIAVHKGYSIDQVDCVLCHNPHSSSQKNLVFSFLHEPFKKNECDSCHTKSDGPIGPASGSSKACFKCHRDAEKRFKAKKNSHIVPGPQECTFCHNPHGSARKDLVKKADLPLCTACHEDMGKRLRVVEKGLNRHPEVRSGRCSGCHDAHATDEAKFLKHSPLKLCTVCHPEQNVACHPVGDKALDPRSNTPIDCITCHNPMEARHPQIMRLDGSKELCNQCHKY